MEYLRTPKQTADKNGLTLFKDKDKKPIIIDFSVIKDFFNSNAAELDKIGLNSEEVFAGFTATAIEELENNSFIWSDFVMIDFKVNDYRFNADFMNERTAVYFDGMRKYGVLKPIATRLSAKYLGSREAALCIDFNNQYYQYYKRPIQEVNI